MSATVNTDQLANDARCIDKCIPDGEKLAVLIAVFYQLLQSGVSSGTVSSGLSGIGSPEGSVTASPGTTYLNLANGSFYVKFTGSGNTGWLLKVT